MGIIKTASFDLIGRMIHIEVDANIGGNQMIISCGSSIDEIKVKNIPFFESLSEIASEKLGFPVSLNEELKNFINLC